MTDEPIQSNFFRPRVMGRFIERLTGLQSLFQKTPSNHPILQQDLKDIPWLQPDPRAGLHRLVRFWLGIPLVVGAVAVLELLARDAFGGDFVSSGTAAFFRTTFRINELLLNLALLSLFVFTLIADLVYVMGNINVFSRERTVLREMIRITTMPPAAILDAKYVAAQLKSWCILTVEYIPRLYLLIVFVPYVVADRSFYLPLPITVGSVVSASAMVVGWLFYFLEARWRMRALTALSLAISTRTQDLPIKVILGCFAIVCLHIVEIFGLVAPLYLISKTNSYYESYFFDALKFYYLSFALVIITIGLLNYVLLRTIREIAYRYALRHTFQDV